MTLTPTPRPLSAIEKLTPASDGNYYHTVQSGEYLAWIADLYEVTLAQLMVWNNLNASSIIRPGQQLLLRVTPPATSTPTPAPPSATLTLTQTPSILTPTPEPVRPSPRVTTTPETETPSGFSGVVVPFIVVLIIAGGLILGWVGQRKQKG